jgi:hypothetical protein
MTRWVVASLALLLAAPAAAAAREPVISYVDQDGVFRLYDEQTEAEVEPPPPVPVANAATFRYGISLDGRYIVFTDSGKKLHLLDRATNTELTLPGIDVYAGNPQGPQNLTVSNTGLIAFDNNNNGPAVVYNTATGAFVEVGLAADNGHRQTRLSGDGRFLATTCVDGCVAITSDGADPFVQDLTNKTDTSFPFDATRDEEHTCINGDGSFVGYDRAVGMTIQKNIFLYDRNEGALVALDSAVNDADEDEVRCILDSSADHIGFTNQNGIETFQVFEQSTDKFLMLPADKEFNEFSLFSEPYSPPAPPPPPPPCCGPAPDVTKPVARRFRMTHRRFRPHRGATKFRFRLSETADVRIVVRRRRLHGRRMGALRRDDLPAGRNSITFSGKFRGHGLRPGRYVAVLTATDAAGNRSRARSIRFTVVQAGGDRRP